MLSAFAKRRGAAFETANGDLNAKLSQTVCAQAAASPVSRSPRDMQQHLRATCSQENQASSHSAGLRRRPGFASHSFVPASVRSSSVEESTERATRLAEQRDVTMFGEPVGHVACGLRSNVTPTPLATTIGCVRQDLTDQMCLGDKCLSTCDGLVLRSPLDQMD